MATPKTVTWNINPHTIAKHRILENYLKAWFPILNRYNEGINYIDGFAGPGEYSNGEKGSPIIALDVAKNNSNLTNGDIYFLFVEEDLERAEYLAEKIDVMELPRNFRIVVKNGRFDETLNSALDDLEKAKKILAPTFAFIDPFGFSGIPAKIISRLLSIPKVEVLINFSVDSINRFIGTEESGDHISQLFGTDEVIKIFKELNSEDRKKDLRDLYQIMLGEYAKFVRYFEMCNQVNTPIYYLFFCSNNSLGHIKMKEAMWRVDAEGDYKFSDATDQEQIVFFKKDNSDLLMEELKNKFKDNLLEVRELEQYVFEKTAFIRKHLTGALKLAEKKNIIEINEIKSDGKKRRAGTFPNNVILKFK